MIAPAFLALGSMTSSPYHDNSQIRSMIGPNMTAEQRDETKRLFEAWRPRTAQELKTTLIALPAPGGVAPRSCPAMT